MPEPTREKDKDKSAKWLIEHHGDTILRLGGVTDLVRWQVELSTSCLDLEHFQAGMRAIPRPPEPWDPADEPEPTA